MANRTLYACNQCRRVTFHPLKFCKYCPGKLEQKTFPFPDSKGYFVGHSAILRLKEWVESLGLIYPG